MVENSSEWEQFVFFIEWFMYSVLIDGQSPTGFLIWGTSLRRKELYCFSLHLFVIPIEAIICFIYSSYGILWKTNQKHLLDCSVYFV